VSDEAVILLREQAPNTVTFVDKRLMNRESQLTRVVYDRDCDIQAFSAEGTNASNDLMLVALHSAVPEPLLKGPVGSMVPGQFAVLDDQLWVINELPEPAYDEDE